MSFESQLKARLKARMRADAIGNKASDQVLGDIDKNAGDIAYAVANDVQLSLAADLKAVTKAHDELLVALAAFMTAFTRVVIVPGDGGAATKAACAASASQITAKVTGLKQTNTKLEGTVTSYVG